MLQKTNQMTKLKRQKRHRRVGSLMLTHAMCVHKLIIYESSYFYRWLWHWYVYFFHRSACGEKRLCLKYCGLSHHKHLINNTQQLNRPLMLNQCLDSLINTVTLLYITAGLSCM